MLINHAVADKWWPLGDAIDALVTLGKGRGDAWNESPREVVGVVVRSSARHATDRRKRGDSTAVRSKERRGGQRGREGRTHYALIENSQVCG
jgi:hypothetical protein